MNFVLSVQPVKVHADTSSDSNSSSALVTGAVCVLANGSKLNALLSVQPML